MDVCVCVCLYIISFAALLFCLALITQHQKGSTFLLKFVAAKVDVKSDLHQKSLLAGACSRRVAVVDSVNFFLIYLNLLRTRAHMLTYKRVHIRTLILILILILIHTHAHTHTHTQLSCCCDTSAGICAGGCGSAAGSVTEHVNGVIVICSFLTFVIPFNLQNETNRNMLVEKLTSWGVIAHGFASLDNASTNTNHHFKKYIIYLRGGECVIRLYMCMASVCGLFLYVICVCPDASTCVCMCYFRISFLSDSRNLPLK